MGRTPSDVELSRSETRSTAVGSARNLGLALLAFLKGEERAYLATGRYRGGQTHDHHSRRSTG
jgi:hypothetical protein